MAVCGAVLLAAGALAGAANQPSTVYVDRGAGFEITIPKTWQTVPRSLTAVKALISRLEKQKRTELAGEYNSLISSADGRSAVTSFVFQAFLYPQISPVQTEVTLGIVRTPVTYTAKDLLSIGQTFVKQFAKAKGAKIDKPKVVTLPAGPAALVEGTAPAGSGLKSGFELYLVPHGKRLFGLSFTTQASLLSEASPLFDAIARLLSFV